MPYSINTRNSERYFKSQQSLASVDNSAGATFHGGPKVVDASRHRWDKENEFSELTLHWFINHCYIHHEIGTTAMMYAFMIA